MKTLKKSLKKLTTPIRNWMKSRRGWALIMIAYFLFLISVVALAGPLGSTTKQLYDVSFEMAISRAQNMAIAAASPIRTQIVNATYKKVQQQLIQHLQQDQGSINYVCGDTIAVPKSLGGTIETQYGMCLPENFYLDILGDTNKSIDFISTFYPNYKTPVSDPINEAARKATILQLDNKYDYTLRGYFVGKYVLSQGASSTGATRIEQYRWTVRADMILKTGSVYGELNKDLVVYYDVVVTNNYYPGNFLGAGSACDEQPTYTTSCPTDAGARCYATVFMSANGNVGTGGIGEIGDPSDFGIDPSLCSHDRYTDKTTCSGNNGLTITYTPVKAVRIQKGCASLNTGVAGITTPDKGGYIFELTVRIVSIGNSYN